jgi:hypothetical protein
LAETFTIDDVRLMRAADVHWCCINDRTVLVAARHLRPGTTVRRSGDQGRIVIPLWLARDLGLAS